jgi:glycosyltransferase involved in cell wall biosynthesis
MKIAFFTPYLPYPLDSGGKIRSYYLLRALSARFDVDLYTVYYAERPPESAIKVMEKHCCQLILFHLEKSWRTRDRIRRILNPLPRLVEHFLTPSSLKLAREMLVKGRYELIIADELCMTPYAELAPNLPRITIRHKIDWVHYKEVGQARPWAMEKILDLIEAVKLRRYERLKMPFYQACVVCSEQDAAFIRQYAPRMPILIIPNGVDLDTFAPLNRPQNDRPTLLYVGSLDYYPNIDAIRFFFQKMYDPIRRQVPNVRVLIVGRNPPPDIQRLTQLPGVEIIGSVPDVRPYYEQATILIVPLRLGGGTRLKIVEAMAMGLPVVSTSIGAEGLKVHPGENILIADDPLTFVNDVLRLLSDTALWHRIAAGGRQLAQAYDWRRLTEPVVDLVEQVIWEWKR